MTSRLSTTADFDWGEPIDGWLTMKCDKSGVKLHWIATMLAAARSPRQDRSMRWATSSISAEMRRPYVKGGKRANLEADTFEIRDATERRLGDLMPHKQIRSGWQSGDAI
jgi:hypothetical protein